MSHKEIILDTGFFIAMFCKTDRYHKTIMDLKSILEKKQWITTWPVLTETAYFLHKQKLYDEFEKLLELYEKGVYEIFNLNHKHFPYLKWVLQKYRKLPIDLADASLLILAEELGHGDIVSTDQRDFETYRWKNHKPFKNLFNEKLPRL